MAEGLSTDLVWPAFWVGVAGVILLRMVLPIQHALPIVFTKMAIPFIYFAWFYDGSWTFLDDLAYLERGASLVEAGYNPFTAFFNSEALVLLMSLSGGHHILYGWWNHLAQYLFGQHYFSPVFLNVGLTFVGGYFLFYMAELAGFSRQYAKALLVFFLFHWDVLLWSSFVNLKDIMVMTLTIVTFYLIIALMNRVRARWLAALAVAFFIFVWLRFYVPIVIIAAFLVTHALGIAQPARGKYMAFLVVMVGGYLLLSYVGIAMILNSIERLDVSFSTVSFGVPRMLLTPRPWSIDPHYSFLLFPSVVHWFLLFPAAIGGWRLWQRSKWVRIPLIYLLLTLVLYGSFEELQGPRQRVQLTFILAWMQFHFLWIVVRGAVNHLASVHSTATCDEVRV